MVEQIYEDYWKITLAHTNIYGDNFIGTLKIIVEFIDKQEKPLIFSEDLYKQLQEEVMNQYPKSIISTRKNINQFVKLGFINPHLESYHEECWGFLKALSKRKRKSLFSKIVYSNSKFNASLTKDSKVRGINFLIKTLEENGRLHKRDIISMMTLNLENFHEEYLSPEELEKLRKNEYVSDFFERKYNQVGHFWNVLNKLDDLYIKDGYLYFEEDAKIQFGDKINENEKKRDNYLHRLYKNQLKEESIELFGIERCMVENLAYPSLVASHIKPFIDSSESEAYNPNNGILLSRNMDILFDQGYISFSNDGDLILNDSLQNDVKFYLSKYKLNKEILNDERKLFLEYHRNLIFKKIS